MNHVRFKEMQTAAAYVAGGLEATEAETFELHLFDCTDCLKDVEVWRAIKQEMPVPPPVVHLPVRRHAQASLSGWRLAASLAGTGTIAAALGWFGKGSTTVDLDSTRTVVLNLPSVSRGAEECTAAHLAPDTQTVIIRVPAVSRDSHVVLVDSDRRELPANQYVSRIQPDGSYLIRLNARVLSGQGIQLEARDIHGPSNPIGCLSGEPDHR